MPNANIYFDGRAIRPVGQGVARQALRKPRFFCIGNAGIERGHHGFTLLEIMIVVAIIGLLSMIAVPSFLKARRETLVNKYLSDLRNIVQYVEMYEMHHDRYPPDTLPGVVPDKFTEYVRGLDFSAPTPLGGLWDWDNWISARHGGLRQGIRLGITVITSGGHEVSDNIVKLVDEKIDDGNLSAGRFRRTAANAYTYVIEE